MTNDEIKLLQTLKDWLDAIIEGIGSDQLQSIEDIKADIYVAILKVKKLLGEDVA